MKDIRSGKKVSVRQEGIAESEDERQSQPHPSPLPKNEETGGFAPCSLGIRVGDKGVHACIQQR